MKTIITVFRKELKDSLRDRRTVITMVILPLLLFPVLIGLTSRFVTSYEEQAQEKTLTIGLSEGAGAEGFLAGLDETDNLSVITDLSLDEATELVIADSLSGYLLFHEEFPQQVEDLGQGEVTFYRKQTEERAIEAGRIFDLIDEYEVELRELRFAGLGIDPDAYHVISVSTVNLATGKEQLAEVVGGILPYMFILFCFLGCMYPAIDLAAGEKERGTLETLLTSPVNRTRILIGKFGVVVLTGISSAAISLIGLYLGVRYVSAIPAEFIDMIMTILEPGSIVLLLTLLLPLTIFFASLQLTISFIARSYKEAQSMIGPLYPVIIVPAFLGMMPGMKLTAATAVVPILNVSLATKSIVAGQTSPGIMMLVYVSLIVYASLGLFICGRTFGRESAIFR